MELKLTAPNGSKIEFKGTTEEAYGVETMLQSAHEQGFFGGRERTNAVREPYVQENPALSYGVRTSQLRLPYAREQGTNVSQAVPYVSLEDPQPVRTPYVQPTNAVRAEPETLEATVLRVVTALNPPAPPSLPALPASPVRSKSLLYRRICVGLLAVGAVLAGGFIATRQVQPVAQPAKIAPKPAARNTPTIIPVPALPPAPSN
jgi:hypothetical protein